MAVSRVEWANKTNVTDSTNKPKAGLRPMDYWWLWVLDTGLVTGAFLFYLATQYGTYEFFGRACLRALLPLIPVLVLVGGAGSTIFVLTKVLIEKRDGNKSTALALLIGQALVIALPLVALGVWKSPRQRLAYICVGHAPSAASDVRLTGYSSFLREEWLAVFRVEAAAFQKLVGESQLVPLEAVDFKRYLADSSLQDAKLFQQIPAAGELKCYQRVFRESTEHERGSVLAVFDPASSTAFVFRGYRD